MHVRRDPTVKEGKPRLAVHQKPALTAFGFHGFNTQSKCIVVLDERCIKVTITVYQSALNEDVAGIFWLYWSPRNASPWNDGEFSKLNAFPCGHLPRCTNPVWLGPNALYQVRCNALYPVALNARKCSPKPP